jgi:predicted nucleotidyltransferase
MPTDFLSVLKDFQDSGVRYVLVGDLVGDLAPEQAAKAVEVLLSVGFKAGAPVDARLFADSPMDFDLLFEDAVTPPLAGLSVRVASIPHLIEIKKAAGRPKDIDDARRLA